MSVSSQMRQQIRFVLSCCIVCLASTLPSITHAQQFQPRGQATRSAAQNRAVQTVPAVSQDLLGIYQGTKSAKSDAQVTEIIDACDAIYQDRSRSAVDRNYALSLVAWGANRRGEMRSDAAAEFVRQGNFDQADRLDMLALRDFERATKLAPDNWRAHHNLAISLAMQNGFQRALEEFSEAIELNPKYANSYFNRGEIYFELENYSAAIQDYSQAISIAPSDPQYFNSRAHSHFLLEEYEVALEDYKLAAKLAGDSATYQTDLADALQFLGRWEVAARAYQQAVAIDNRYARAYQNAAWLMSTCPEPEFRNPSLALAAARKAIELQGGESAGTLDTLAAATAESGKHDEAVTLLQKALRIVQDSTEQEEISQRLHLYEQGMDYRQPKPLQPLASGDQGLPPNAVPQSPIRTASNPSR